MDVFDITIDAVIADNINSLQKCKILAFIYTGNKTSCHKSTQMLHEEYRVWTALFPSK